MRFPEPGSYAGTREARMRQVVARLWQALAPQGVSWVGFYVGPEVPFTDARGVEQRAASGEMLLAVREPKPACSPIGLQGMCGRSYLSREAVLVDDVERLPPEVGYVACDPRDRSEAVLPCLEDAGRAWGVLDLDSLEAGAFSVEDLAALHAELLAAGLTHGPLPTLQRF